MKSSRRALLASVPIAGLAGCLSRGDDRGESKLGRVHVVNEDDEPHTVEFRVEWDGDVVHESTHDVEARSDDVLGQAIPERTWPDEPGRFTLSARSDGVEWNTVDPADRGYPDCFSVTTIVDDRGNLVHGVATNERRCDDEALGDDPRSAEENGSNGSETGE